MNGRAIVGQTVWAIAERYVIVYDVPIVVQHTRLDSRQSALALLSTIAWASTS